MAYCDHCKKNQATIKMVQFVNGERSEYHLCEECAAKIGTPAIEGILSNDLISSLFGGLLGTSPNRKTETLVCPQCGTTYKQISHEGRLGCPSCYTVFSNELARHIRRLQGNTQHTGKFPLRNGHSAQLKKQIDELKTQLQNAITSEEYEKAATFRDKIKELEKLM